MALNTTMSHRIACYTLFDITKTGVLNRSRPPIDEEDEKAWYTKRNTQSNFDTILQVISLRAQPDIATDPQAIQMTFDDKCEFGYTYKDKKKHTVWTFDFEVQADSVFEDGINDMGALYKDCDGVPMIKSGKEVKKLGERLSIDNSNRNIYFVKY